MGRLAGLLGAPRRSERAVLAAPGAHSSQVRAGPDEWNAGTPAGALIPGLACHVLYGAAISGLLCGDCLVPCDFPGQGTGREYCRLDALADAVRGRPERVPGAPARRAHEEPARAGRGSCAAWPQRL